MKRIKTIEDHIVDSVNYVLLTIITVVTLYPFYYILIISFNSGSDTAVGGIYLIPRDFTFENYEYFFQQQKWIVALGISVLRTLIGTVLSVLFTCIVAYGLSKRDLLFRRFYFISVLVAMYVSGGLIAYYIVLRSIGLINSFSVYVVPTMLSLFFLIIAVTFFQEIPQELGESARIDGASEMRIFLRIILPISLPLIATMSLFLGSGQWNAWLDSAYFVQSQNLRTLSYRMIEVMNEATFRPTDAQTATYLSQRSVTPFSVQVTAMVISILTCPFLLRRMHVWINIKKIISSLQIEVRSSIIDITDLY